MEMADVVRVRIARRKGLMMIEVLLSGELGGKSQCLVCLSPTVDARTRTVTKMDRNLALGLQRKIVVEVVVELEFGSLRLNCLVLKSIVAMVLVHLHAKAQKAN